MFSKVSENLITKWVGSQLPEQHSIKKRSVDDFVVVFSLLRIAYVASTRTRSAERISTEVAFCTWKEDPIPNFIHIRPFVPEIFPGEFIYGLVLEQGRMQAAMEK